MNVETGSLVLRTCDLNGTNNPSGSRGSINSTRTSMTWNNINLRLLLGPMYDKYDMFNLVLKTISSGVITGQYMAALSSPDSNNIIINMSGLPFRNQTYDIYKGVTNSIVLCTYQIIGTNITNQNYFENNTATFMKSQDTCNLSINYTTVSTNSVPNNGGVSAYADTLFLFDIVGIPKEEGNKNGTRMF